MLEPMVAADAGDGGNSRKFWLLVDFSIILAPVECRSCEVIRLSFYPDTAKRRGNCLPLLQFDHQNLIWMLGVRSIRSR